jgi:hypothetical protein
LAADADRVLGAIDGARRAARARAWRLRLRLLSLPAQLARHARQVLFHLPAHVHWAGLVIDGITRLRALTAPG